MRILVIGGTGGFGSTICTLLRNDGHEVVSGSRHARRDARHIVVDRDRVTSSDLAGFDLVVDAAGPFQGQGRHLLETCISAGVHHLDIADDRAFVAGVSAFDEKARQTGVVAISGASSVPALSSAAALEMSHGMDEVQTVRIAISASAAAVFGRSVLTAMLSGAGRRIPVSCGRPPVAMLDSRDFLATSPRGDLQRTVLACDAPDVTLTGAALPGNPVVLFHAGSELAIHNASMRLVALAVRMRILRSGASVARLAGIARRATVRRGSGRSAMTIDVVGTRNGSEIRRNWSLVAENGSGPMIPCLAVPALVERIAHGSMPPGARSSVAMLGVSEILARMPADDYDITITEVL